MTFYINNKRGNGYQPNNRPKNLIPPNKKPSYKPKESNIKEDCKKNIQLIVCSLCHYKNLVYPEDFGIAINIDKEEEV